MSSTSGLKTPSVYPKQTGTKPKSKLSRLTSPKFSPKKQQTSTSSSLSSLPEVLPTKLPTALSSPKRWNQTDELAKQFLTNNRQCPTPKNSPKQRQDSNKSVTFEEDFHQDEMGLTYGPESMFLNDEPAMSFLEFESLYNFEKELEQARRDTIAELDEKCILGGWFGTRRGVYTELPDPCRNSECIPRGQIVSTPSQIPTEGFSFAPGWSLNPEHFYQWQQRGKSIQQVGK